MLYLSNVIQQVCRLSSLDFTTNNTNNTIYKCKRNLRQIFIRINDPQRSSRHKPEALGERKRPPKQLTRSFISPSNGSTNLAKFSQLPLKTFPKHS